MFIVMLVTSLPCFALTKAESIDELVSRYYDIGKFNGVILVAEKGKIIYHRAFGVSNIEMGDSLSTGSQMRLASVSKQFTAMAIMILREQGKLNYDEDVRTYLPELEYSGITVRHLLTHTSGLPDRTLSSLYDIYWDPGKIAHPDRKILTSRDVYDLLVEHHPPLEFEPGSLHRYCNTGYILLALIVENLSGMEFDLFMERNIFEPLGMHNTLVYIPLKDQPMANRALGFRWNDSRTGYVVDDSHYENGITGAGGMYSTTGDMYKWDQALYAEELVCKPRMDEALTGAMLTDSSSVGYGFGWSIIAVDNGIMAAHGGGWLGFRAFILRDIADSITVIQLCNMPGIHKGSLAFKINDILEGRKCALPKKPITDVLVEFLYRRGMTAAMQHYRALREYYPDGYNFDETEVNSFGYELMGQGRKREALAVFELNTETHPQSWNAFDSLAEAHLANGNTEQAIKNYTRSLKLNPDNTNARRALEELMNRK